MDIPADPAGVGDDMGTYRFGIGVGTPNLRTPATVDNRRSSYTSLSPDLTVRERYLNPPPAEPFDCNVNDDDFEQRAQVAWDRIESESEDECYLSPWDYVTIHPGQCIEYPKAVHALEFWGRTGEMDPAVDWVDMWNSDSEDNIQSTRE